MTAFLSPAGLLNAIAARGKFHVERALGYGANPRQVLDIYHPLDLPCAPVVVFFYGGGWEAGERALYLFVGAALARHGFLTVVPDYRLYPEVHFPGFLEDAALAVDWSRRHARQFGGDPDRIVLAGHSAGAHIAAMLAFDGTWLQAHGLDPRRDIRGMVGLAGPYDFLPLHSETLKRIFGPESGLAATQPINFVAGEAPPALLATGRRDRTVDPGNTLRMAARLRAAGNRADVRLYPGIGHRGIIGALAAPLRPLAPVLRDVTRFMGEIVAEAPPEPVLNASEAGT